MNLREVTTDSPADGLVIFQPRRGFRYAMDPILLVGWALEWGDPRSFIDIGTGSGVMALLLVKAGLSGRGIDVLPEWVSLARRSGEASGLDARFDCLDARDLKGPPVDLVVCNPPYFPQSSGTPSPNLFRAASRHECAGTLADLVASACRMGQRVCMSLPAQRSEEAERLLEREGRPIARRLVLEEGIVLIEGRDRVSAPQTEHGSLRGPLGHSELAVRLFTRAGARLHRPEMGSHDART